MAWQVLEAIPDEKPVHVYLDWRRISDGTRGVSVHHAARCHIPLTGIVDGNEVIISPQITGRMIRLTVDEGSQIKKGDLVAELDARELEASLAAAKANIDMLTASVSEAQHNVNWTNEQTSAALNQAGAIVTSTSAQVEQAKANVWRVQMDYDRAKMRRRFRLGCGGFPSSILSRTRCKPLEISPSRARDLSESTMTC
jgi:hypothetical protein